MTSGGYAHPPRARNAAVGLDTPWPAAYLAAQVNQSLRHGLPARHRLGPLKAAVARRGLPEAALARLLRVPGRRPRPDLDRLLADVAEAWPTLAGRSRRLPPGPPSGLSALAVERSAGLTVFLFSTGPSPAMVLKVPAPGDDRVDREAAVLEEAEAVGIAPRFLGRAGAARVQEGLPGAALDIAPVTSEAAASLAWNDGLAALSDALAELGRATARNVPPDEVGGPLLERAAAAPGLSTTARAATVDAVARAAAVDVAVLKHSDTSPQNCLFDGGRLSGVVDWELANRRGAPGFDVLNAAVSAFEHGVGLWRWSEPHLPALFATAWRESPFFDAARAAAAKAARAAGVDDEQAHEAMHVAYFARRLGRRLAEPGRFPTGPETAARMLEATCGP